MTLNASFKYANEAQVQSSPNTFKHWKDTLKWLNNIHTNLSLNKANKHRLFKPCYLKEKTISYQPISSNGVTLSKLRMGIGRAMPYWVGEIVPAGTNQWHCNRDQIYNVCQSTSSKGLRRSSKEDSYSEFWLPFDQCLINRICDFDNNSIVARLIKRRILTTIWLLHNQLRIMKWKSDVFH